MSPCSVYISKLPDPYLVPLKLLLDRKRKPKPGSLISATHRRGVHFSQDFLLSAFSFPPFFLVHIFWLPWDRGSGFGNSVKVLIRGESQDHNSLDFKQWENWRWMIRHTKHKTFISCRQDGIDCYIKTSEGALPWSNFSAVRQCWHLD